MAFRGDGDRIHVVPREVPPELLARIAATATIVLVAFTLIAARLWFLQMVKGAEMRDLSEHNRIRLVRVPSARGAVFDRHGEVLIDNRPSFDVVFVPEDARERKKVVLRTLADHLGENEAQLHER